MNSIFNIGSLLCLAIAILHIQGSSAAYVPSYTCKEYEVYQGYDSPCSPKCANLRYPVPDYIASKTCKPGCFCKKGYYQSDYGNCVSPATCCNGPNEEYRGYSAPCSPSCSTLQYPINKYAPAPPTCKPGCFCKAGFYRAADGKCVSAATCCNGPNEEYRGYSAPCSPPCSNLQYPINNYLPAPPTCQPGCFCKAGSYRATDNTCVQPDKCCTGAHECYSAKGTGCPATCANPTPYCSKPKVPSCVCDDSYVRQAGTNGSPCIKSKDCKVYGK